MVKVEARPVIERIEQKGILIHDCTLPGETKADDIFPAHANGIQVSRDRWLNVYATRGFRFIDDDWSILYQIREGTPDGRLIREGYLSQAEDGWAPFDNGRTYFKQHGHPVAFGVPKGVVIGGRSASHANLFVAKWRVVGMDLAQSKGNKCHRGEGTQGVEWVQFRLNEAEDDIEILEPLRRLRQNGFDNGDIVGRTVKGESICSMNQSFVQAVPFSDDATVWADVNHAQWFESKEKGGQIMALKYVYNAETGLYEWTESGPMARGSEASLSQLNGSWIISSRKRDGVAWFRTEDPFAHMPEPICPEVPDSYAPRTSYVAADGVLRLFTGDPSISRPPRGGRNPLRCWDIDPDDFSVSNMRVVFDTYDYGLPMREACGPVVDMGKLLPHMGGREQYFVHRVRPKAINYPANCKAVANAEEKDAAGIYCEKIVYSEDCPGMWTFA